MSSLFANTLSASYYEANDRQKVFVHPKKINISLLGRFMRQTGEECPCRVQEISLHEISLLSSIEVKEGETILCLIDQLGLLRGNVERQIQGGFLLSIHLTSWGRKLLADRLNKLNTFTTSSLIIRDPEVTFNDRIPFAEIFINEDLKYKCQVEDLWLFGASLITEARPTLGSQVFLNQIRSRVEEHHTDGIIVEFSDMKTANAVRRHFEN